MSYLSHPGPQIDFGVLEKRDDYKLYFLTLTKREEGKKRPDQCYCGASIFPPVCVGEKKGFYVKKIMKSTFYQTNSLSTILERKGDNWGTDRWGRLLRSTEVGIMGRGEPGGGRSLQKKQTPESLRYTILTKGGSLVLNKEGFQENEQSL